MHWLPGDKDASSSRGKFLDLRVFDRIELGNIFLPAWDLHWHHIDSRYVGHSDWDYGRGANYSCDRDEGSEMWTIL